MHTIGQTKLLFQLYRRWRVLREIVDMPNRKLELFIKLCFNNRGRLSATKRSQFRELSDEEVELLEEALRDAGL